jgi:hypothetical protein
MLTSISWQGGWATLTPHPNEPVSFYGCWPLPFLKGPGLDAASLLNLCGSRCSMSGHGTTGIPPTHQRRFTQRACQWHARRVYPENLPAAGSKGPGPTRPRDLPPLSFHLNYRNDCVIISRALISSPQGGCMIHAARASTASARAPLPTCHFLIGSAAIKNARNSPENNALHFSNRLKTANCSARFSHVSRLSNHESRVAAHGSPLTTHQSRLTNHIFLIASRQILKIALTRSQQTRKHFLIASFSAISAPARRGGPVPHLTHHSPLIPHHRSTPFLFDTNNANKIIILVRALLKTKEKQFSIRYKFASRHIANLDLVPGRKNAPHFRRARNAACLAVLVVLSCPAASGPNWFAWLGMGA